MSRLATIMHRFERDPYRRAPNNPIKLISYVGAPASRRVIENTWRNARPPADAIELWSVCNTARLFLDIDYGQWGLSLLSPDVSAQQTREIPPLYPTTSFRVDDVIVGEFVGDTDLLLVAPSEVSHRRILVAHTMEPREEWTGVGESLAAFLETYFEAMGEKFWDRSGHTGPH